MSDISGIKKRKVNRDKLVLRRENKARSIVRKLLDIDLLQKSDDPQQSFNTMWHGVDEMLKNHQLFRGYLNYVDAYNKAIQYCQDLIEDADIDVGFPKHIVTSDRPKRFRNQGWFNDAKEVLSFYLEWMNHLETSNQPGLNDIFLSLIFHSGVLIDFKLNQILIDLISGELKVYNVFDLPVIDTVIRDENLATNTRISNEKGITDIHESKTFLSPLTARLIQLYVKDDAEIDNRQLDNKTDKISAHKLYKRIDNGKGSNQISLRMGLKRFLLASIYVLEDYLGINLPEHTWYLLTNQEKTYTIPTPNWQSIVYDINHNVSKKIAPNTKNQNIPIENSSTFNHKKPTLIIDIAKLFRKTTSLKLSKSKFISDLSQIHTDLLRNNAPLNEIAITGWLLSKTDNCKVSSIRTYNNTITNRWLSISDGMQFETFEDEDFYYFYYELIELGKTEKAKNQIAIHIDEIHQYLVNEHGVEPITPLSSKTRPHYKTGYISENMFLAILAQVDSLDINREAVEAIKLSLILGHRCGMRIGEIVKIRLNDIALLSYLEVRNNRYGDNKTSSALRRLLLEYLLNDAGKDLLKRVYAKRLVGNGDTLIATQAGIAYSSNELSSLIGKIIKEATGLSHLTTHHLRHSFLTNFQLMSFLYDPDYNFNNHICYVWLKTLIPYSENEAKEILLNIEGLLAYKRVFALAGLAGHASPSTTYASYVHLSDIQIGLIVWQTDFKLTQNHVSILKLPRRQKAIINNPLALNEYVIRKAKLATLPKPKSYRRLTKRHDIAKRRYGFNEVNIILDRFSKKQDYEEWLIRLSIDEEVFARWLNNARYLKESDLFQTIKGNPRLFAPDDKLSLTPSFDRFDDDKKVLTSMTEKYRELYTNKGSKRNKLKLHFFVQYTLMNSEYNNSVIRFNSYEDISNYLEVLSQLVNKKDIRIKVYNFKFADLNEKRRWIKAISTLTSYNKNISYIESSEHSYQRSIRAEISLASQTELQRIESRKRSTHPIQKWTVRTIQIFCHYVYIMIGERIQPAK